MDPILMLQILRYAALAPQAIPIIVDGVNAVKAGLEGGETWDDAKLAELASKMELQHAQLPVPE